MWLYTYKKKLCSDSSTDWISCIRLTLSKVGRNWRGYDPWKKETGQEEIHIYMAFPLSTLPSLCTVQDCWDSRKLQFYWLALSQDEGQGCQNTRKLRGNLRKKSHRRENHKICIQIALKFLADPELCIEGEDPRKTADSNSEKTIKSQHNLTAVHHRVNKVWNLSLAKLEGLRKHIRYSIKIPERRCRRTNAISSNKEQNWYVGFNQNKKYFYLPKTLLRKFKKAGHTTGENICCTYMYLPWYLNTWRTAKINNRKTNNTIKISKRLE